MASITIVTLTCYNAQELYRLCQQISDLNDVRVEWYIKSGEQTAAGTYFLQSLKDTWQSKVTLTIDRELDRGIYDGWNIALKNLSSTYYCNFNPDDELIVPNFKMLLDKDFESDFVVFPIWENTSAAPKKFTPGKIVTKGARAKFNGFATSLLVRCDIHNRLGLFDLRYRIASDIDFLCKALKDDQLNIEYSDYPIGKFGTKGTSSRLSYILIRECAKIYFTHYGAFVSLMLTLKIIIVKIWRSND